MAILKLVVKKTMNYDGSLQNPIMEAFATKYSSQFTLLFICTLAHIPNA